MSKEHSRKEIEGIDPMTYGKYDKFMERAQKVAKYILPVLGASLLAGCNAQMLDAIARKAQAPEVSPLPADFTATFTPTEVATKTPTLTLTPEPTSTVIFKEPEVREEKQVFLTERIAYDNYQFDFEISLLNDDEIIRATFEKYGIESVSINEEKVNARELLAKTLIYSFVETYNFQNGTNVSMNEYMANPSNYPTLIKMRGEDGEQEIQSITLDKIKNFDLRYTSGMNGELYMNFPGIYTGYSLDHDKFILYGYSTRDSTMRDLSDGLYEGLDEEDIQNLKGLNIFSVNLFNSLALVKYTLSPHKDTQDTLYTLGVNFTDGVKKIANATWPGRMSVQDFTKWMKESGTFFKVD